jgi:WG containing repeat
MPQKLVIITCFIFINYFNCFSQTINSEILIPYKIKNLWGYSDTMGNILLQPQYDSVGFYEKSTIEFAIFKHDGKYGTLNKEMRVVIKNDYATFKIQNPNYVICGSKNALGLLTLQNKIIAPFEFDKIEYYSNTLFLVKKDNKSGLFNIDGQKIAEEIYVEFTSDYNYSTGIDDIYGVIGQDEFLINLDGTRIFKGPVKKHESMNVRVAEDMPNRKPDYSISPKLMRQFEALKKSQQLTECFFERSFGYSDPASKMYQYYVVGKKGKVALWNVDLNIIDDDFYDEIYDVSYALDAKENRYERRIVKKDSKWGIITNEGKVICDFQFDTFENYEHYESLAKVSINGKKGIYLYNSFYQIISCKYDSINIFKTIPVHSNWSFLVFKVKKGDLEGYVGENGVEYFK